jgi:hypothetical protein
MIEDDSFEVNGDMEYTDGFRMGFLQGYMAAYVAESEGEPPG